MRALTIALVSLTGCAVPGFNPDGSWEGLDDDDTSGTGGDTTPPPAITVVDGSYQLRSQYDVTVDAVLPEPAYELVGTMNDFSVAPGHTLLDLAEQAGVPAVGTIRDALPSSLENKLEGWIDDQIANITIGGVPITQIAGELADLAQLTLADFAIDSTLTIDGTTATHTLTKIEFTSDAQVSLANLPATVKTRTATAQITGGSLVIGDHGFGLPYGQLAWQAFEQLTVAKYGATPRELLGDAVNCPAIASAVANKCVLGLCVGHKADLTAICNAGLDEVIAVAQRKVEALQFEAIHHARGTATLVDADRNGRCDGLAGGVWTAQLDLGQGLRSVPATFSSH